MAPGPLSMVVRRNFSGGGNVDILLILFRLLTAIVTNALRWQEWPISYKTDHPQISQAGYFFTKQRIAMVFKKTTSLSLFCLSRLASIT